MTLTDYAEAMAKLRKAKQALRKAKDGDYDIAEQKALLAEVVVHRIAHMLKREGINTSILRAHAARLAITDKRSPEAKLAKQKCKAIMTGDSTYWMRRLSVLKTKEPLFTDTQWATMQEDYKGRCAYCGTSPEKLTKDHIVPLCKGGQHTRSNIVPACRSCNSRKRDRPASVLLPS